MSYLKAASKGPHSAVLSPEQEAVIMTFGRHTLLPLGDYLYELQAIILELRRSSLQGFLECHGISRLPEVEGNLPLMRSLTAT